MWFWVYQSYQRWSIFANLINKVCSMMSLMLLRFVNRQWFLQRSLVISMMYRFMLCQRIILIWMHFHNDHMEWRSQQWVTKPKIWTKPKLFSDTKIFRYRIRYFFRYQNFPKPIPILFSIPKIFETDTDTFFETYFFRNRYRYFFETYFFRNRYQY